MMKDTEFLKNLKCAAEAPSAYMWGTFGNKITESLIIQKAKQYPKNYSKKRQKELIEKSQGLLWGWDCVGLIKGILWGWCNDLDYPYGGAVYASNGVPDTTASGLKKHCTELSSDFTTLIPGELLFMPGHIGVYVGEGQAIESTLGEHGDGIVFSKIAGRGWKEHGKCNFVEYQINKKESGLRNFIFVEKVGLYVRESLQFKSQKANGKVLKFCPIGGEMEIIEFIPGIQPDGYQWVKTRYNDTEGYSQYDSKCYYIFNK